MPLLDPETSSRIAVLQILDDAISYRLHRQNLPCPECTSGGKCPEHAWDQNLIDRYQEQYAGIFQETLARMDPDDIARIMQPGDDTTPTAGALSIAVLAALRDHATDGPVIITLDSGPVIIERDGPFLTPHAFATLIHDADPRWLGLAVRSGRGRASWCTGGRWAWSRS
jgi:hypothetical protein